MKYSKSKSSKSYYSIRSYLSYLSQFKLRMAIVMISFIIANALLVIIPVFIGKLVGTLADKPIDTGEAYLYVWLLIASSTGHDLFWRLSEILYRKLYLPISYSYETLVFEQVIHKPYPFFVDKFTGKVSSYINTLGTELRNFVEKIFWDYTGNVVNLVSVTVILTVINWQTGLIFIVGLIAMVLTGRYTMRNATKYEKVWADVQSTKNGKIIDAIANFVNVKSFRTENRESRAIYKEQDKMIDASKRSFLWSIVFWGSMSQFVRNFIWPATILLNVHLYLEGQISIGELTTFLAAILMFTNFIWEILWQASQFTLVLARIEEAHRYLFGGINIITNPDQRVNNEKPPMFTKNLEFRNLSFTYPEAGDSVLTDISLTISKGEKIGIVGKSGSGKTTLTKLLLDYYQGSDDSLLLDGVPVDNHKIAKMVSYVPQDTSLFHRTIAENISYAAEREVSHDEIVAAAKKAHAHEFIREIPEKYDVLVGERGVKLSAGQRQRIAIARAFLDDKPILVLDEATSALDSESELLVQQALEALWQDKTVIAIAHRLSTLRNMDRIIVMSQGKIIETGSHEELLAKKGQYAKLWAHQSGGFLDES
jgi:ATP-binding cassette, subfamily B, bacterial